jgi:hypothetical protein
MRNGEEDFENATREEMLDLVQELSLILFEEAEENMDPNDEAYIFWGWHTEALKLLKKNSN